MVVTFLVITDALKKAPKFLWKDYLYFFLLLLNNRDLGGSLEEMLKRMLCVIHLNDCASG